MFCRKSNEFERRYGYFRCSQCKKKWESSHVYCYRGNLMPAYGQECKDCHIMCMPYRTEPIRCSQCHQTDCNCDKRHTDPNKNHRSDLCAKCQAGHPCV